MATAEKAPTPAYVSPRSLTTFANKVREDGHIPMQVDRTLLSNFSGSTANELLASLKFLGMIRPDSKPTAVLEEFAMADDDARKPIMERVLRDKYAFLFNDPEFDLARATTGMVTEKFRQQGISGSTLARAISFFLTVAKDSGVKVSSNVKAPSAKPANGQPRPKKDWPQPQPTGTASPAAATPTPATPPTPQDHPDTMRFEIPVPNKPSVKVIIPESFDADDWELLNTVFAAYIKRWKGYADTKDKGPTPEKK